MRNLSGDESSDFYYRCVLEYGTESRDFFNKVTQEYSGVYILAGKGTFHQIHGGVSTNGTQDAHPWEHFHQEYIRIKGPAFQRPEYKSTLWGVPQR